MINQRLWIPVGHFTSPINAVVLILRDLDIDAVWRAADDAERRMLVEELIEWVTVFPDHLEVPSAIRIQKRMSRVLHWIGDVTSRSTTTVVVVVVVLLVIFAVILAADGFPMSWEAAFSTIAGAVTLVMLFVVQHTQGRNHLVLQLKLDELIRSSPDADDLLVRLEVTDDSELNDLEQDQLAHHESLREPDDLATSKEGDKDA